MLNEIIYNKLKTILEPLELKLVEVYKPDMTGGYIHLSLGNTMFEEQTSEARRSGLIKGKKEFIIIIGNTIRRDVRSDGDKRRLMNNEIDVVTYTLLKARIDGVYELKHKNIKQMNMQLINLDINTIYSYLDDGNYKYEALIEGHIHFTLFNF